MRIQLPLQLKCRWLAVRALLDTGAKVKVKDIQTMNELGMSGVGVGLAYGVGGVPITIVGTVEIPLELETETCWVQIQS